MYDVCAELLRTLIIQQYFNVLFIHWSTLFSLSPMFFIDCRRHLLSLSYCAYYITFSCFAYSQIKSCIKFTWQYPHFTANLLMSDVELRHWGNSLRTWEFSQQRIKTFYEIKFLWFFGLWFQECRKISPHPSMMFNFVRSQQV